MWWVPKDKDLKLDIRLNKVITPFMEQYRCLTREEIQQRIKKDLDFWRTEIEHGCKTTSRDNSS